MASLLRAPKRRAGEATQEGTEALADLCRRIRYEPTTGEFFWTEPRSPINKPGAPAGYCRKDGYRVITLSRKVCLAHRVAWFYMTGSLPTGQIDHINRNPSDNSWRNLRLADSSQQIGNTRNHVMRGIRKNQKTYSARIEVNGKERFLGGYATLKEAQEAYDKAAVAAWGEHYNGMRQR